MTNREMKTKKDYISREAAVNAISKAAAEKWEEHFWSPMPDQNSTFVFGVNVAVDAINSLQPATLTNGNMIRQMTDEELAVLLSNTEADFPPNYPNGVSVKLCETSWLDWLEETIE